MPRISITMGGLNEAVLLRDTPFVGETVKLEGQVNTGGAAPTTSNKRRPLVIGLPPA